MSDQRIKTQPSPNDVIKTKRIECKACGHVWRTEIQADKHCRPCRAERSFGPNHAALILLGFHASFERTFHVPWQEVDPITWRIVITDCITGDHYQTTVASAYPGDAIEAVCANLINTQITRSLQ